MFLVLKNLAALSEVIFKFKYAPAASSVSTVLLMTAIVLMVTGVGHGQTRIVGCFSPGPETEEC